MTFDLDNAKGHVLGGNSPRSSNIYMNEMCKVCEKYLEDGVQMLRARYNGANIVICAECAQDIHNGYESQM